MKPDDLIADDRGRLGGFRAHALGSGKWEDASCLVGEWELPKFSYAHHELSFDHEELIIASWLRISVIRFRNVYSSVNMLPHSGIVPAAGFSERRYWSAARLARSA